MLLAAHAVAPAWAERLPLRAYTVADGLPHNSINDLLETLSGELWVVTNAGIARFDPGGEPAPAPKAGAPTPRRVMFTSVKADAADLYAEVVTSLPEARDGTIWCGTFKGLMRLDRTPRPRLTPIELPMPGDMLEQKFVYDLVEDRHGSLWMASPSGLCARFAARPTWRAGRSARRMPAVGCARSATRAKASVSTR
jgi:ligand-binding sensor domain-containing protein